MTFLLGVKNPADELIDFDAQAEEKQNLSTHVGLCSRRYAEMKRAIGGIKSRLDYLVWIVLILGAIELAGGHGFVKIVMEKYLGITLP